MIQHLRVLSVFMEDPRLVSITNIMWLTTPVTLASGDLIDTCTHQHRHTHINTIKNYNEISKRELGLCFSKSYQNHQESC